eukprot:PhM_4_TR16753/c0_g1_i2/m.66785
MFAGNRTTARHTPVAAPHRRQPAATALPLQHAEQRQVQGVLHPGSVARRVDRGRHGADPPRQRTLPGPAPQCRRRPHVPVCGRSRARLRVNADADRPQRRSGRVAERGDCRQPWHHVLPQHGGAERRRGGVRRAAHTARRSVRCQHDASRGRRVHLHRFGERKQCGCRHAQCGRQWSDAGRANDSQHRRVRGHVDGVGSVAPARDDACGLARVRRPCDGHPVHGHAACTHHRRQRRLQRLQRRSARAERLGRRGPTHRHGTRPVCRAHARHPQRHRDDEPDVRARQQRACVHGEHAGNRADATHVRDRRHPCAAAGAPQPRAVPRRGVDAGAARRAARLDIHVAVAACCAERWRGPRERHAARRRTVCDARTARRYTCAAREPEHYAACGRAGVPCYGVGPQPPDHAVPPPQPHL